MSNSETMITKKRKGKEERQASKTYDSGDWKVIRKPSIAPFFINQHLTFTTSLTRCSSCITYLDKNNFKEM